MVKHLFSFLLFLLFIIPASKAQQSISLRNFQASAEADDVKLVWELENEGGISEFRIYRKLSGKSEYEYVTTQYANGGLQYQYIDENVFKTESVLITYQLRIMKYGNSYDFTASFSHQPTAIQRTWGSIKSSFR